MVKGSKRATIISKVEGTTRDAELCRRASYAVAEEKLVDRFAGYGVNFFDGWGTVNLRKKYDIGEASDC